MKTGRAIRKGVTTIIALGALAAILFWMSGGFQRKIEPGRVPAESRSAKGLNTATVHAVVEMETAEVVGTLKAERRTDVSSKIMAAIADIGVKAGDKVRKGQVVVTLDDRDLRARVEQARKAMEAGQATARQAAVDLERYRGALAGGAITRQQFDQQESAYKIAQANLEGAQQAVKEAEVALSFAKIEAPTDGVVVDKHADKGDTAMPGKPILTIYDPTALRLEAPVRETLATNLHVGDALRVHMDALDLDVEGRMDEIVPQAEAASRSVLVKVSVPRNPKMVEGMFGRLIMPTRERRRLCVPVSAIRHVGQLAFVDVVTTGGALDRRLIQLGEHHEYGRVEALSGVEAGDRVALYGPPPPPMPPLPAGMKVVPEDGRP